MSLTKRFQTLAATGFLVGTLDGLAAIVNYVIAGGKDPARIFLFIASGVFGKEAVGGNDQLAWWGVLFHYFIAFCWTVCYFMMYPKVALLAGNKYLSGTVYGIFVWLVMNLVVVPLSRTPPIPLPATRILVGAAILIVCVGLPISLSAHRFHSKWPDKDNSIHERKG